MGEDVAEYAEYMCFLTATKAEFLLGLYLFIDQLPMFLCHLVLMLKLSIIFL